MYAERLETVYILNPNWFLKTVMSVIRPFLSERSKSKFKVVEDIKELKLYFDDDCLIKVIEIIFINLGTWRNIRFYFLGTN